MPLHSPYVYHKSHASFPGGLSCLGHIIEEEGGGGGLNGDIGGEGADLICPTKTQTGYLIATLSVPIFYQ